MNKAGYKIIHIGDGTEKGFSPIVIVKANPIIDHGFYASFVPHENIDTEEFFFPDEERIANKILQIARGEGIWHPTEDDFKDETIFCEDLHKSITIHRHKSFWTEDYDDMNSGESVNLIPDIQYKARTLINQFYQGNWFETYCSFRSYVESLAEGDDVQNFWGWLFNRSALNGCLPYDLPEDYYNEYERFLDVCENLDDIEY